MEFYERIIAETGSFYFNTTIISVECFLVDLSIDVYNSFNTTIVSVELTGMM